ncbi:MAG: hypothetical protein WBA91_02795, partial [Paracoccaceae bacterium]
ALRVVEANGAVAKSLCGSSVSSVLRQIPGFEHVGRTLFPKKIMRSFGELPGVVTVLHKDTDSDDRTGKLLAQSAVTP